MCGFALWPKVAAVAIGLAIWQLIVWSGWRPEYVLPAPATVFQRLGELIADGAHHPRLTTAERAAYGFAMALVIGVVVGGLVSSSRIIRSAVGSLITGLQTMPSIAWFPLAIVLFDRSERAITFVIVLGAPPRSPTDSSPASTTSHPCCSAPDEMMGATGFAKFRHVVLPAVAAIVRRRTQTRLGVSWRSLMAGELIVVLGASVGFLLQQYRNLADAAGLIAMMIVILVVGIVVDAVLFGSLDRAVRRRHGLIED